MYARFANIGVRHDLEIPPSSRKPTNKPAENADVEEQLEDVNMGPSSREVRQELAEGLPPDCAEAESDM